MTIEDKCEQVDEIGNIVLESGALGSTAINTSTNQEIEYGASGRNVLDIPANQANNPNEGSRQDVAAPDNSPPPPFPSNIQ